MTNTDLNELLARYNQIENEISLLKETKKELLEEFKDRVDPKAFKAALSVAKKRMKMTPTESSEYEVVLDFLEKHLSIEYID